MPLSTRAECNPNCGADTCGSKCATGMPCDTGCCSANHASIGNSITADQTSRKRRGVFARDSENTLYELVPDGMTYSEQPVSGTPYQADLYYLRWTAAGWRWGYVATSADPQDPGIGLSTTYAEIDYLGGAPDIEFATVPLK